MTTTIEELEARLEALEAERAAARDREAVIARLLAYSRTIDLGQHEEWIACFSADGAFEMRSHLENYPSRRRVEGRAELADFIATHTGPPETFHKHLYLMPEVAVDGNAAHAAGYFVHLVDDESGSPILQSYGRYRDTLVRDAEAGWLIRERIAEIEGSTGAQR